MFEMVSLNKLLTSIRFTTVGLMPYPSHLKIVEYAQEKIIVVPSMTLTKF